MATLKQDIESQAKWIVKAFKADGLKLDYSIESFKKIDDFIQQHANEGKVVKGGRLEGRLGPVLFSLAAYIGQTFIKVAPGTSWKIDEDDPEAELNIEIVFPDQSIIWPMQRMMKRFQNGEEDSIMAYGYSIAKQLDIEIGPMPNGKSKHDWWKFWQ